MSNKDIKSISILLLSASLAAIYFILGCGGGGGGGGSSEIATASLNVEPTTVEVGGGQLVTINLSDVYNNLAVKIRHPNASRYVVNSARFTADGADVFTNPASDISDQDKTVSPSTGATATPAAGATPVATATATATPTSTPTPSGTATGNADSEYAKRYLVFYLTRDAFGSDNSGTLSFVLRAKEVLDSGKVELDVDLDDPSVPNNTEFSLENPQFEAEQSVTVRLKN